MAKKKGKILIVGATGYIGKYIARASALAGNPTWVLVRPATMTSTDPAKVEVLGVFKELKIKILQGDLNDHASLLAALKLVNVVISAVGSPQTADQLKLIEAIKEVNKDKKKIKRFYPAEFSAIDVERATWPPFDCLQNHFQTKMMIRKALQQAGIPYTYLITGAFAGRFLANLGQRNFLEPPKEKVVVYGTGEVKAVFMDEEDVATYTIKSVDDPRAENKLLYFLPKDNIMTQKAAIKMWEVKNQKKLEKEDLPDAKFKQLIQEVPYPENIAQAMLYTIFVKGEGYLYQGKTFPPHAVEVTELYPDVRYNTPNEVFNRFLIAYSPSGMAFGLYTSRTSPLIKPGPVEEEEEEEDLASVSDT